MIFSLRYYKTSSKCYFLVDVTPEQLASCLGQPVTNSDIHYDSLMQ